VKDIKVAVTLSRGPEEDIVESQSR